MEIFFDFNKEQVEPILEPTKKLLEAINTIGYLTIFVERLKSRNFDYG